MKYVFWAALCIIFYSYIGYGITLIFFTKVRKFLKPSLLVKEGPGRGYLPDVTMVVAAYNEEGIIRDKICNCLGINYPAEKISFLFVTDGSSDSTNAIIEEYPQITLLHQRERKGKTAALNRAMEFVNTPITIFCDANSMLNKSAIINLVKHYRVDRIGGVSGEKRVLTNETSNNVGKGEGLYWKYESFLKRLDAELYTVTGAAGELFSIRTSLWTPLPEEVILDDFVISGRINLQGYRIGYEPEAFACESSSASMDEERKRKVRIAAGAFQAMSILKELFNFSRHPILFFQYFSHRFLRWTLTPLSFPIILLSNILILIDVRNIPFIIFLSAQACFYLSVFIDNYFKPRSRFLSVLRLCHYVFFMNYSIYLGFARFIRGNQSAIWEKAVRDESPASISNM